MLWNKPESETSLVQLILGWLKRELPAGWTLRLARQSVAGKGADATLELGAGRQRTRVPLEVKFLFEPRHLLRLDSGRRGRTGERMLVAPYLSRTAQAMLTERGWSFADATGNVRLVLERPPLYIRLRGAEREPWRVPRPLRSLRGRIAGRVVRALCDFRPPFGVRELAERSRTSAPTVSRVVAMLDREALLERRGRGPIIAVDWVKLLHRWTEEYVFSRSNRVRSFIALRGLPAMLDRLRRLKAEYSVTGSFAAQPVRAVAPPRLAMIFARDVDALTQELDLEPAEAGANVLLATPFDPVAFERTWEREGLRYAALSQVAADLLSGPGRSPQEGEALIEWMREHEPDWRT